MGCGHRRLSISLFPQSEGEPEGAAAVACVLGLLVSADFAGKVTELVENQAEVQPSVVLSSLEGELECCDRFQPAFLGGKAVAEVEGRRRRPEIGRAPEARLRVA